MPRDLDLHVQPPAWLTQETVRFSHPGSNTDAPWIQLDKDITTGHGPETIRFFKAVRGRYRVAVCNYSKDGELSGSKATVLIEVGGDITQSFDCPTVGVGDWWHVCDIDFHRNKISPVNRISAVPPFETEEFVRTDQLKVDIQQTTGARVNSLKVTQSIKTSIREYGVSILTTPYSFIQPVWNYKLSTAPYC